MGKSKGKILSQKRQSNIKPVPGVGIPSRSSLKKKHAHEKAKEKKVRFSGKLTGALAASNASPKVIVQQIVDSDDDEDVSTNKSTLKQNKNKNPATTIAKCNGNQKLFTNKHLALVPKANMTTAVSSESEEETESEMDDDDSVLAALWDASDIEDDSDDSLPFNVDLDSVDSEDEIPSSVVIEEIPNKPETTLPATQSVKQAVSNTKPVSLKRPAEVKSDEQQSPPLKKKRVASEKEETASTPMPVPLSKPISSNPKIQDKTAENNPSTLTKTKSAKKRTIEELLAPYVGKCTPAEFKRLKKKFKAQERKKRSKVQKLYGKEYVGDLSVSQREELLSISDQREEELSHRSLYIRPVPNRFNYAALKKTLPTITGCRIPPKNTKRLPSSSKGVHEHAYKFNRGYAFIEFSTPDEARNQLKGLKERNKPIFTFSNEKESVKTLTVRSEDEKPSRESTNKSKKGLTKQIKLMDFKTLHVGGLPCHVHLNQVEEFLKSKKVVMPIVAEGNLGFCLVKYNKVEDAVKVFQQKHGKSFHGSKLCITFAHRSTSRKGV